LRQITVTKCQSYEPKSAHLLQSNKIGSAGRCKTLTLLSPGKGRNADTQEAENKCFQKKSIFSCPSVLYLKSDKYLSQHSVQVSVEESGIFLLKEPVCPQDWEMLSQKFLLPSEKEKFLSIMSNIISFISFHSLNILTQNINAYLLLIF
jgi:hypothetical protein